jgi:chemotaxis protein histidine kinase CheA/CheY-like chemotaxis protein
MAIDLMKFLARFIEEAREHINGLNQGLLSLEKNPGDTEVLNAIFRAAHTLKGSSRMMKLMPISEVAHKLEEVLEGLRSGRIKLSKELSNILFEGIDVLSDMVEKTASGAHLSDDTQAIRSALERAAHDGPVLVKASGAPADRGETEKRAAANAIGACGSEDSSEGLSDSAGVAISSAQPSPASPPVEPPGPSPLPSSRAAVREDDVRPRDDRPAATRAKGLDHTIRVNTEKLDGLIKLAGEMVSTHGLLKQRLLEIKKMENVARKCVELSAHVGNGNGAAVQAETVQSMRSLHRGLKQLVLSVTDDVNVQEHLTLDLQENALCMRMLPLSTLFDSFRRVVRDLSASLEKEINFITEGGETELDKKMIEKLGDPIIHMIRNGIDHGIETPEERLEAGKPAEGTLRLSACYEGESVLIELSDDGAGIWLEKLKDGCRRKRIFDDNTLNAMQESELVNLIFYPGFSTSEIITDISGRGVGMDVVKRNIVEHLKGSIQVETKEGKGTTFRIRLLLTLAIMHVLLVSVSGMVLALPASSVSEVVRVAESEIIDVVDKKAARVREQIIPVVNLHDVLELPRAPVANERGLLILIVAVGGERLGLVVDALLNEENVVMKPLPPHMQDIRLVSGVTTSGGNEVINVLNISEVFEAARDMKYVKRAEGSGKRETGAINILVVDDSLNTREIEKSILESYGYSVTMAADGMEALEKTAGFRYDVIVTDVEMPRLDGFSLTERLRKDDMYKDTPIILVTSRDRESDKRRGIQVGANAYIVKGAFDQSNLVDTIRNFVG